MLLLADLTSFIPWSQSPTLLLIVVGAICLAAVIKGADWLVEAAAGIATQMGIPKVIVGATIVSLGTTAPEVAVSVLAAFTGNPGLALGNGVGSIIADTGLIFGVGAMLCALPADRFVLTRQAWVQFGSAMLLAVFAYGAWWIVGKECAAITRWMGIFMLVILAGYLYLSTRWSRQHPGSEPHLIEDEKGEVHIDSHDEAGNKKRVTLILTGFIGLLLVIFCGDAFVQCASISAERFGVPQAVIAGTIVALGTSMPELIVGITSIRKGHPELLVGNIIGADILNALFVVGLSSVAADLPLFEQIGDGTNTHWSGNMLWVTFPTMIGMLLLMRIFIWRACTKGKFSRWMGLPLFLMYIAYLFINFMIH